MSSIHEQLKAVFATVPSVTVIGGSCGDEGKGKVIDLVIKYFDAAVRFSGGANAGHTVYTDDGKKIVSHLIPCELAQQKKSSTFGSKPIYLLPSTRH